VTTLAAVVLLLDVACTTAISGGDASPTPPSARSASSNAMRPQLAHARPTLIVTDTNRATSTSSHQP
jgi:hypothetical protein